ncbi:MAG: ABC transporter permease, partial [Bacteroidales bacterium]|nr:ABC transporter permease [Bacteroidales bacterium]
MDFRIIRRIARTELATLFYSPVAWILIVVLAAQIGSAFIDILNEIVKIKALGNTITFSATAGVVLGGRGIYEVIQDSIYLYIPLLTMNLMSREYASGSDKLLYSSPVSSVEIIAGKFLATLACTAVLVGVLALPSVAVCIVVPNPDVTLILAGLASMFLLIMTYCSIGLFMSALTSYQVVAAVATL